MSSTSNPQQLLLTRLIRVQRKRQRERRRAAAATPSLSSLSSHGLAAAAHGLMPCFAYSEPALSLDASDPAISVCVFPTGSSNFLVRVFSSEGAVSTLNLEWPQRTSTHALSLSVSAAPLAVIVTASDSYVYRVNLQPFLHRNQLPHVVSSAAQNTLRMPSLAQAALQASENLPADRVLQFTDKAVQIPSKAELPPLCSTSTKTGSVIVCGLAGGYVHIVDMEDSRARTVPCGSRDIVDVDLLSTTVSSSDLGLLEVQLLVATCELGVIHVYPLSVSEGSTQWWIFEAREEICWFVPDCQSGDNIVQLVNDLGKAIEHATAALTDVDTFPPPVHRDETDGEGHAGDPTNPASPSIGWAGWLLVANKFSGKSSLYDLRECMAHWLRYEVDMQRFCSPTATSATTQQHKVEASESPRASEHSWKPVAEIDLKSELSLPSSADILTVTEFERSLCVSYSIQDDTGGGIAEVVVASISVTEPGNGTFHWRIQHRVPFSRSDTPTAAVKVRGRWTSSAGGQGSRDSVIFYSPGSVLYLSKRMDEDQSRWLHEDPIKIAAAGKLDDAISLAVKQLQSGDEFPGRQDLLVHVAVWMIELAKTDEQLENAPLLRQVLLEIDLDDFCALLPSLISAGRLVDVLSVCVERRCVPALLSSITSQTVATLNLAQTNQLVAAGYANELAVHADGLLFKRLGTSAQLSVLLSARRTFNHCSQRVLEMLPSLNLDLLRCVIWVLMNWAAPSTADQSALEASSPATIANLGILDFVRQEWERKRSLADAFQSEAREPAIPEAMSWTTCELEVGITCWLAFLMQKCRVVSDYMALLQGGMAAAAAYYSDVPAAADEPGDVSQMMMRILDERARIEELQSVLMRLLASAHSRCNIFLLLGRCIDLHNFPAAALVLELSGRNAAALSMSLRVVHLTACFSSSADDSNIPSPMVNKKRNFWHRVDEIANATELLACGQSDQRHHPSASSPELEAQLVDYMLSLIQHLVFSLPDSSADADKMIGQVLCLWAALKLPIAPLDRFLRQAVVERQSGVDVCRLLHTALFASKTSDQAAMIHSLAFPPDFYLEIASAVVARNAKQ